MPQIDKTQQPPGNDPASNLLKNDAAMAILEDACGRLRAMGLNGWLGPESMFPTSPVSVALRVASSERALDENIVGGLLAGNHASRSAGRREFDELLAGFAAEAPAG